jgi:YVTN family beta-propeller protein
VTQRVKLAQGVMSELPSGAVTFLFTDVEGSTRLLKQLRDRYGEVLSDHGRLLREAFSRHGGHVVDTQGDSFFVAFTSARQAVLAAVEAQRALAEHTWPEGTDVRVRMGIHTGQAAATEERYLGVAVHRAARIAAGGHGGQVLVSQTTHNLLEDEEQELPGVELRDLGEQRLKDLDRPVRVFQVTAQGLRTDFPPLRTAAPPPAAAPPYRRRSTILVGALAGVIAAAVAIPVLVFGGDGGGSGVDVGELEGNAVAVLDTGSGAVRGVAETPIPPTAVAAGFGYVWTSSADSNTVVVVDTSTNTVRDTIPVESASNGIVVAGDWAWVTNSLTGTVSQISPETLAVVQNIPVGNGPTAIASGNGHIWVANTSDHTVTKLRATDGKKLGTFAAGPDPGALAFGEGAVWVASKAAGAVVKLSPTTGEILDRIPVGDGPAGVAVGAGSVWVANSLSGTVSRIDPRTGDVRGTIEIGSSADAVAVAGGDVWVASGGGGTVSRVDPRTGQVTPIDVGNRPTALAAEDSTVYVALRSSGAAHRGGTLSVALPTCCQATPDPAIGYDFSLTLPVTNDGLVGWKRVGGQAGLELVPDLAVSLPSVSDDRRTYTFQLRSGIHYSDGRLVKPSDVRYSFERLWTVLPRLRELFPDEDPNVAGAYFGSIVGADGCNARPARCELTRGIVTDDGAGTVSFRLTAPDPDFLFKLALPFALVLPKGTSPREPAERPLPATGPYVVASAVKGSTRLVRNPRFREWSSAAQPAGFPDEIVVSTAPEAPEERVQLVIQDKADLTLSDPGRPLPVPLTHRSQLHVQRQPTAFYVAFDVTREPFDDVRARRAVNYALDRAKVIGFAGGADAASPSCQILPPNFPAYKQYCPYTLDSNASSGWTAPDLAKARKLIVESGTEGADVALWWHREFGEQSGRYIEQLLDSLGYRARLRLFSGDVGDYFTAVQVPGASWNMTGSGWLADYPAASQFIQLLACSNFFNLGHFCDQAVDAKITRALELQESDPAAANESWAALDRELTDQAPWVTLYNFNSADFLSERVGNYQHHPISGTLLAQLWVR